MAHVRTLLTEAALVAVVGVLIALAANQASPRGLRLTRDYFPSLMATSAAASSSTSTPTATPSHGSTSVVESASASHNSNVVAGGAVASGAGLAAVESRVRALGLVPAQLVEVEALFRDPRYAQELVVFVDARDDHHFQEGHIPGARQLDRFYPERYLPAVLPRASAAEVVVVYCTGGECEDSVFAAGLLQEAGIGAERLRVYLGGFREWSERGLPVERGTEAGAPAEPAPGSPP